MKTIAALLMLATAMYCQAAPKAPLDRLCKEIDGRMMCLVPADQLRGLIENNDAAVKALEGCSNVKEI